MQLEHQDTGDFNVDVNLHLLPPSMTMHCNPVSDNAKTSCTGGGALANGIHAKHPLLDLAKELIIENTFKKTQDSMVSTMISKHQQAEILTTFQPHCKV